MKTTFLRTVAASCAIGLLPATVQAQLGQNAPPTQNAQQPARQPARQPATQQPALGGGQQQPGERLEARRVDPSASTRQGQMSVEDFFVTQLMQANKAEVELSQLAAEKSQNQSVKQYAQQMVQDHQQMNQKLQQLKSGQQLESGQNVAQNRNQPRLPQGEQRTQGSATSQSGQMVPQALTQVAQQAADKYLQMSKEMLQQKQGQDFDMGFLAMQIVGHTQMLAGLQAMQNVGSPQFQQHVEHAEQQTSEHIDQAKQLAKKLEDDRKAGARGSDPDASSR